MGTVKAKGVKISHELRRWKVDVCAVQETSWKGDCTRFVDFQVLQVTSKSFGGRGQMELAVLA